VPDNCRFDVVVAADVIYDRGAIPPLFTTAARLMRAHHGVFLLGYVGRCLASDTEMEELLIRCARGCHAVPRG
jgi:predicted TPR repeat methyltransferase